MLLLVCLGDDSLGYLNGVWHIVHIEVAIQVVVDEVAGFIVVETADVITEPLLEILVLRIVDIVFEWFRIFFVNFNFILEINYPLLHLSATYRETAYIMP